ncbi:MAG TPA: serine/threonine-protein kinase [Acidobacteriaceae bacterium]
MLSSGDKLGQYEILRCIGAGGMGEVFRARDSRLHRDVAIKVLPAGMADNPDRLARFQREARAVAALNHPHIVTIYSVEHTDGVHFLTMEVVEGQPLSALICPDGLAVDQIVTIAAELADALSAAHDKGIVHRDLKPANVMVTHDGRVKVLDFGLAKEVGTGGSDETTRTSLGNTQPGMVMGTPAYMSPEQISGRPLDHRTDIFSFGVVLHEMATGRQPFQGNSAAELISAILRDTPAPVTDSRPDLPGDLARIVRRCLEKDPRHRMQTARDVANEFRDLTRPAPPKTSAATQRSDSVRTAESGATRANEGFRVAVLPFKSSGPIPEVAALADGLSEEIVTGLSRFSYLRVIARGSTLSYANKSIDLRVAGQELGARHVMDGTLRQAGAKLRVAVQLIDAVTGANLWAETYEREFSPNAIFELQDDLVPRIVSTVADLYGVLPHSMSESLRSKADDQLNPHEAVIRSFGYHERLTPDEHAKVRKILEDTVCQAPDLSDAWAMLSWIYWDELAHGFNIRPDPAGPCAGSGAARHRCSAL